MAVYIGIKKLIADIIDLTKLKYSGVPTAGPVIVPPETYTYVFRAFTDAIKIATADIIDLTTLKRAVLISSPFVSDSKFSIKLGIDDIIDLTTLKRGRRIPFIEEHVDNHVYLSIRQIYFNFRTD
jgi:hypothetical protein